MLFNSAKRIHLAPNMSNLTHSTQSRIPQASVCDKPTQQIPPTPNKSVPRYPSTKEWMKKMWYIIQWNTTQPLKKNEILPPAATWMDLETGILSEVS